MRQHYLQQHLQRQTLYMLLFILMPCLAFAGAGHDHGHGHDAEPVVANPNTPQRLPDGSLFLPKATQRFIKLRTQVTKIEKLPLTVKLNGQVITRSNAMGKVLALQTGRLDVVGDALPVVGDWVKKGQKLATITWVTSDPDEKTNQAAEVADLREQLKLAELEYQRVKKLVTLIPQRDIDAAESLVKRLKARMGALRKGVKKKQETLRVPLSGMVTGSYATDQQAVQAGDVILEMVDPKQLQVEALSFDPSLTGNIASARLQRDEQLFPLQYKGTSPRLRQQALPLRFAVTSKALTGLVAGLPVTVLIQTKQKQQGVPIPADALARNGSNQAIVWVKTAPENYAPRLIQHQPLDGERVLVTTGLKDDERVVIQATTLINQIR